MEIRIVVVVFVVVFVTAKAGDQAPAAVVLYWPSFGCYKFPVAVVSLISYLELVRLVQVKEERPLFGGVCTPVMYTGGRLRLMDRPGTFLYFLFSIFAWAKNTVSRSK
jgi:hypothetical protein